LAVPDAGVVTSVETTGGKRVLYVEDSCDIGECLLGREDQRFKLSGVSRQTPASFSSLPAARIRLTRTGADLPQRHDTGNDSISRV
jgi:hypothetical protein